ncbi:MULTISPECIES: TonB-dependent receptor [unclassified Sphingomonas]|uniref:TonB-dependent receptor n=1 Tax=unclassified Sphingomonas TaxID=196159 RepID=UPI0009E80E0B|nr:MULTISPECIES: TonB-dependent receptor [unclassified Sphingomonas]
MKGFYRGGAKVGHARVGARLLLGAASLALFPSLAAAQEAPAAEDTTRRQGPVTAAEALQQEIVVTATKRVEDVQDVPLAITAFGSAQLETLNYRDIGSLGFSVPNVQLDDNGATIGFQNFSIRGLGVNSGSPSIDPTVGVFVDGVYLGTNAGVLLDSFDLEAVEVLRGPQGVLFGRNVTGGAVLVRTKKPTDTLSFSGRISAETGPAVTVDATVAGPLIPGKLTAKLAAYYTYDDGWFTNLFNGASQGQARQFTVRPMLRFTPSDAVEVLLRYEHTEANGDGPASQNHALYSRDSFDFAINEKGFFKLKVDAATLEANIDIGPGTLTNIFGWRKLTNDALTDVDATTGTQFHFYQITEQEQFSNELRYSATIGRFEPTLGVYYFTQDLNYIEQRILGGGAVVRGGGGFGTTNVIGAFAAVDWHFTDSLTLNLGGRYTREKKDVSIGTIRTGGGSYFTRSFIPDFASEREWSDFSPRVGLQFEPNPNTQVYGFFARGFRSGGYNFRATVIGASPGPFDSEQQDSFEVGVKQRFAGRKGHINVSLFRNSIDGIQREIQVASPVFGIAQLIQNVGTVRVQGFEADAQFAVTKNLVFNAFVGYVENKYTRLAFDLNGDLVINATDFGLKLPRLSPWTYGGSVVLDVPLGDAGTISNRVSFSHRDKAFHLENNLGFYNPQDTLDFNISYTPRDSGLTFSVYGTNVLNSANYSNDSVLTDVPIFGGDGPAGPRPLPTFSPLTKGRVIGGEVRFKF